MYKRRPKGLTPEQEKEYLLNRKRFLWRRWYKRHRAEAIRRKSEWNKTHNKYASMTTEEKHEYCKKKWKQSKWSRPENRELYNERQRKNYALRKIKKAKEAL